MTPKEQFRDLLRNRDQKAVISVHRGLWGPAPENSVEAIAGAADFGIVEIDVQLAKDMVPVVVHDDTLDRMTAVQGRVSEQTSSWISGQALRRGDGGPHNAVTEERAPLLQDVLDNSPAGAFFDFDVKHSGEVEAVAAFIADRGAALKGSVKIDVNSADELDGLLKLEQTYGLMVMAKVDLSKTGVQHIALLREAGVAAAEVWFEDLDQLSAACSTTGEQMAISTYTLDPVHCCGLSDKVALLEPDQVWGRLIEAGVDIIMTDRPNELQAYLNRA